MPRRAGLVAGSSLRRKRTARRRRWAPPRRGSSRRRRRRELLRHRRQLLQRRKHQHERPHRRRQTQCQMPASQLAVCARRRMRFRRRWLRRCSAAQMPRRLLQPTRVLRMQRAVHSSRCAGVRVHRPRGLLRASPRLDPSCATQRHALRRRRQRRRDWRLAWHRCSAWARHRWRAMRLLRRCRRRRVPPRRRPRPSRPPHRQARALKRAPTLPTTTAMLRPGRRDGRRSSSLRRELRRRLLAPVPCEHPSGRAALPPR